MSHMVPPLPRSSHESFSGSTYTPARPRFVSLRDGAPGEAPEVTFSVDPENPPPGQLVEAEAQVENPDEVASMELRVGSGTGPSEAYSMGQFVQGEALDELAAEDDEERGLPMGASLALIGGIAASIAVYSWRRHAA